MSVRDIFSAPLTSVRVRPMYQGWSLQEMGVPALIAWMDKCKAKESVAGTVKDPESWVEVYKKFLSADYFERAGVAKT